jgi:hypothetical protein
MFHPFTSVLRECLVDGLGKFIGMLVRGIVEETNLFSIPAAPPAKEDMNSQADSLHQGEFSIKSLRLQAAGLLTSGGQNCNRFSKRFHESGSRIGHALRYLLLFCRHNPVILTNAVAADVRRRILAHRVPPPHLGGYASWTYPV